MQTYQFDVFLSYSSHDRAIVRRLANRLRKNGLRVWFDQWQISPGMDISMAIKSGIEASRTLVLCLSPAALGSGWITLEQSTVKFRDPKNNDRRFVPLLIGDCELPNFVRQYKYVDYRKETKSEFKKLLTACKNKERLKILSDPNMFDFLDLKEDQQVSDTEKTLNDRIVRFLLELGNGFAFIGNNFRLQIAKSVYYIDMLFYHINLRCYIIIELKDGKHKPEYIEKLNYYLKAVDTQLKRPDENPSIGILLYKSEFRIDAEYSLRNTSRTKDYLITHSFPDKLISKLPSIQELENELTSRLFNIAERKESKPCAAGRKEWAENARRKSKVPPRKTLH